MPRNFWMITCNEENFNITREMDFTRQGLKSEYRRKVQRVEKDDRLLFYVMGIRKFTATATVTASYKEEDAGFWKNEGSATWPYLIGIKPELVLDEEQYIEAGLLAHRLDYIRRWPPENWYMAFPGKPSSLAQGRLLSDRGRDEEAQVRSCVPGRGATSASTIFPFPQVSPVGWKAGIATTERGRPGPRAVKES